MWESLTNEEIYLNVASGLGCCMVCHIGLEESRGRGLFLLFSVACNFLHKTLLNILVRLYITCNDTTFQCIIDILTCLGHEDGVQSVFICIAPSFSDPFKGYFVSSDKGVCRGDCRSFVSGVFTCVCFSDRDFPGEHCFLSCWLSAQHIMVA